MRLTQIISIRFNRASRYPAYVQHIFYFLGLWDFRNHLFERMWFCLESQVNAGQLWSVGVVFFMRLINQGRGCICGAAEGSVPHSAYHVSKCSCISGKRLNWGKLTYIIKWQDNNSSRWVYQVSRNAKLRTWLVYSPCNRRDWHSGFVVNSGAGLLYSWSVRKWMRISYKCLFTRHRP